MNIVTITIGVRKCGRRKRGLYLTGGEPSENGVLAVFNLLNPPVPYQVPVHRGPRIVDAYAIIERKPMEDWWFGSSKSTEEKKAGDAWAEDVFGMTLAKRTSIGECEDALSADEALSMLVSNIRWNSNLLPLFRNITKDKIQEIKRVDSHYTKLHEHLSSYTKTMKVDDLIGAQAAIWRMAYNLPPSRRQDYIPNLMRMLIVMNLKRDAIAMQRTFLQGE